jgi:hypothetical protein
MAKKTFVVSGRVIDRKTRGGVAGVRVEAWDKDLFFDDLLGSTLTDEQGAFRIEFDESYFKELFTEGRPDLFFKLFREGEHVTSTDETIRWGAQAEEAFITIEIDLPVEAAPEPPVTPLPPPGTAQEVFERQVAGQLMDDQTGMTLAGYGVHAIVPEDSPAPQKVGYDITNERGLFVVVYTFARDASQVQGETETTGMRLRLNIFDPQGKEIYQTELNLEAYRGEVLTVKVPIPLAAEPASLALSELAEVIGGELPQSLVSYLATRGMNSLQDVRESGGIGQLEGLPVPAEHPAVLAIEAHAALSTLSSDMRLNALLIERGYTSVSAVANTPRDYFVNATGDRLGDFKAAQLQVTAQAQTMLLENVLAMQRAGYLDGFASGTAQSDVQNLFPRRCGCEECEAAISPLAYLADLLDYSVRHLKDGPALITLSSLTRTFHQPFGDLPASCEGMDKRVRQVRLCVEVLRRYLTAHPPSTAQRSALERAERQYRLTAYTGLLGKIGTSFEEVRLARTAGIEGRRSLANRLGISLGTSRPDHLDALFLDTAAPSSSPNALTERALERLFGLVDTTRNPLAAGVVPDLETWRVEHLQALWEEQDRPADSYSRDLLPLIDPDLIGPDDFRQPVAKAHASDPDKAFDVWIRRRDWVDARIGAFSAIPPATVRGQRVPDLDAILRSMYAPVSYGTVSAVSWAATTTPADFELLRGNLSEGVSVEETQNRIRADLGLSTESFMRLMEVRVKHQEAVGDAGNERVMEEEWLEVYSILAQAQKERLLSAWRDEENALGVSLDSEDFWLSLREPQEGDFPPLLSERRPLIDPEIQKLDELVEPTAGVQAIALWRARRAAMTRIKNDLKALRERSGFEPMLRQALGHPNPGDALQHDLASLKNDLSSADEAVALTARSRIIDDLRMSVEAFERQMLIKAKNDDARPSARKPTAAEWTEVYTILASAHKEKHLFPAWVEEERSATPPIIYWRAVKARLPRWRASAQSRREWQQALRSRGRSPVIDPDLIGPADFKIPSAGSASFRLWEARRAWASSVLDDLSSTRAAGATALDGLDEILQTTLKVRAAALLSLEEERLAGNNIMPRLDQIGLTTDGFSYLLRLRGVVAGGAALLDSEWEQVFSILLQVRKRRAFGAWREEERAQAVILGPRHFRIPSPPLEFPPRQPEALPAWRATWGERRSWQETLQSRIDQERSVAESLREAVSAVEEAALPLLRDALVAATNAPGTSLDAKAKWITDHLLIDAKESGCQQTTRVAQAIETTQGILFSVRTAQLKDTYPHLELDADHFDEEWKWIGSYATWRAAMFVFLYPENILLPGLRRRRSPAFRALIDDLRSNRRVTPEQACEVAATYSDYFEDVCKLTIEASCQARTRLTGDDVCRAGAERGYRCLFYMFARGGATKAAYWSAFDPQDESGYSQTFWSAIPGLQGVIDILGAVPYRIAPEQRFVFLFARVQDKGEEKLVFTKYDLEAQGWDQEVTELELPESAKAFRAVVEQQDSAERPPHLAIHVPGGNIYDGYLNREGNAWGHNNQWHLLVDRSKGLFLEPLAMTQTGTEGFHFFARNRSTGNLEFRLFLGFHPLGFDPDPRWRILGQGDWHGAYTWPIFDRVYAFWSEGGQTRYRVISSDMDSLPFDGITTIRGFDGWLSSVFGLSLGQVSINTLSLSIFSLFNPLANSGLYLLDYLTLEPANPLRRQMGELPYFALGRLLIESFGRQIPASPGWREADQTVQANSRERLNITAALRRVFDGGRIQLRRLADSDRPQLVPALSGLRRVAVHSDDASKNSRMIAYQRAGGQVGCWQSALTIDTANYNLIWRTASRVSPQVPGPFKLSERLSEDDLQLRRGLIRAAFEAHEGDLPNLAYLEEAYYFVPIHLALQLQARGQYIAALDWYRTVYDYSMPSGRPERRKIYYGLVLEESASVTYQRALNWLQDPLNPHEIAATRPNTYTRFTLLSLVRCLLEFADAEFTSDTAESVPRARTLYMTALELLDLPELKQRLGGCDELVGTLDIELGDPKWRPVWDEVRDELTGITEYDKLESTIERLRSTMVGNESLAERLREAREIVASERGELPLKFSDVVSQKAGFAARAHAALLTQPTLVQAVGKVGTAAGKDFLFSVAMVSGVNPTALSGGSAQAAWLSGKASTLKDGSDANPASSEAQTVARQQGYYQELRNHAPLAPTWTATLAEIATINPTAALNATRILAGNYIPAPSFHFCVPPNPVLKAMRMRAELNLYKLRNCYNIAGMKRELEPFAAPTNAASGLPTIGSGGQILIPGAIALQPTLYRFAVVIERAKQLAGHAQQIEAAMFSAIEKRDAELYNLLRARQDVRLSRAGVQLQDLRVREAEGGVRLAELQRDRSQMQAEHYQMLLDEGLSIFETLAFAFQVAAVVHLHVAAAIKMVATMGIGGIADVGAALGATSSLFQMEAGFERRRQEWEFQQALARQDVQIGVQQVQLAQDRVRVVGQEREISLMQSEHAEAVVDFLANKFTNVELYDWMSEILERVYSFFLQQTASIARLAAAQLAFERQEIPPPFIQEDYWDAPDGSMTNDPTGGRNLERRGLTGSARLLQDIFRLDQYAFETDRRKLQLTKTISLALLAPSEFQRFREVGVLNFATPMSLFDRDFPGHYLRLVKRVRTSVIALIPPTQGIRATLLTTGMSRVVIGGDVFQTVVVRRAPEAVALSSPRDATGLFELNPQPEMLLPFEGMGVDAAWEFRMPPAANLFDYRSIADVLITFEYTALDSFAHRQQIIQQLDRTISAERPFSFRHQFADPWYDLHNPEQTATPMVVRFATRNDDFPPNLEDLRIQHVALYFARAGNRSFEVPITHLRFTQQGGGPVGGGATSVDGIVSTRRSNATSWTPMIGKSPVGEWELSLPNTQEMRNRFRNNEIEDILFVITYSGHTPGWPV